MEKNQENTPEKGQNDGKTVYEVSYIFLPSLNDAQINENVTSFKTLVLSHEGSNISEENPVPIDLAYSITKVVGTTRHKIHTGFFGWMKFDLAEGAIEHVKKALDNSDVVARYLIVKTVRENTLLNGKMMLRKEEKSRKDDSIDDEVVASDTPEVIEGVESGKIDKSIDELVIA